MATEKLMQQRKIGGGGEDIKYTLIYFVTLSFCSLVLKTSAVVQNILLLFLTLSGGKVGLR